MEENEPMRRERVGRFQMSIWKKRRVIEARDDFDVEREVETTKACIKRSTCRKTERGGKNRSLWASAEELRELARLVDQFSPDDEESPDY
jgi:hypothetical protein